MFEKIFTFSPDFKKGKERQEGSEKNIDGVILTAIGTTEQGEKENLEQFGEYIAGRITQAIQAAKDQGKKLVFDMATGSTPDPVWPKLSQMIKEGAVDLSNVIVIGHEEAWGTYEKGSHSDFDNSRKVKLFGDNNISVQEICSPEQVLAADPGNFVPMHLSESIAEAATLYGEILKKLRARTDVTFFGFYGVGTDGHIGEMQIGALGKEATRERMESYPDAVKDYSFESGMPELFRWQDKDGNFRAEDNVFWERGAKKDETGRAARENYGGMEAIMGIGWREMLRQEDMLIAFNKANKQLAFELALEGSFSGSVLDENGEEILKIERNKGEGEAILSDLRELALELEEQEILEKGTVGKNQQSQGELKCHKLFQAVYKALDEKGAKVSDSGGYYQKIWELLNRYIGKRAPISRLIRLRALLGKPTELVYTTEVVQGTKFEVLQ